jgi:hypothetical protein
MSEETHVQEDEQPVENELEPLDLGAVTENTHGLFLGWNLDGVGRFQ